MKNVLSYETFLDLLGHKETGHDVCPGGQVASHPVVVDTGPPRLSVREEGVGGQGERSWGRTRPVTYVRRCSLSANSPRPLRETRCYRTLD